MIIRLYTKCIWTAHFSHYPTDVAAATLASFIYDASHQYPRPNHQRVQNTYVLPVHLGLQNGQQQEHALGLVLQLVREVNHGALVVVHEMWMARREAHGVRIAAHGWGRLG